MYVQLAPVSPWSVRHLGVHLIGRVQSATVCAELHYLYYEIVCLLV